MIKTLYPVRFNSFDLPGLLPHHPPHFAIAAYAVYSKTASKKTADTTDKSFSEALRPDPVQLTPFFCPVLLNIDFINEAASHQRKIHFNDGIGKAFFTDQLTRTFIKIVYE